MSTSLALKPNMVKKQTTKTKTSITTDQSQKLIQTMLTMSFGCLAFLRGLFPDDNFIDQRFVTNKIKNNFNKNDVNQNNSIKIKTLVRGKTNEADILLDWLDSGVFQSIKLKYLKALSFGIFLNENDPSTLIENYIFNFTYDDINNNIKMNISTKTNNFDNNDSISILDLRKQVQQLMRRFIILTQSLEPLPIKKFLSMHLIFNSNTPQNYQPNHFKDSTFIKTPTIKLPVISNNLDGSNNIGSIDTKHHQVSINVLSNSDMNLNEQNENYQIINPIETFCLNDSQNNNNNLDDNEEIIPEEEEEEEENGIQKENENQQLVIESELDTQIQPQSSITTKLLGDVMNSSQNSIVPTQFIARSKTDTFNCECNLNPPKNATSTKICRICRKVVHGFCYGNAFQRNIPICMTCCYGPNDFLDIENPIFKDLMMLRKSYRTLSKKRYFPNSITSFIRLFIKDIELTENIKKKIALVLTCFISDGTLLLEPEESKLSQNIYPKVNTNLVNIDIPGIFTDKFGTLKQGSIYDIRFVLLSENSKKCYTKEVARSKEEIEDWLKEVETIIQKYNSFQENDNIENIKSLTLYDDTCTIDKIQFNDKKRKNINLEDDIDDDDFDEFLTNNNNNNNSKEIEPAHPKKKYLKISVSKKALKSLW